MKRNKRTLAALVCLLLVLLLAGCGGKSEVVAVTAPPQDAQDAPGVEAPTLPREAQLALFEKERALWAFTEPHAHPWFYTFTDLDHNGLLEVIAASTQGSGVFTYANFYEVLPDGSGLRNCYHADQEIEGPDDWPEIVLDTLPCYYEPSTGLYYYPCEGVARSGMAWNYATWNALCLKDGVAEWELLATKTVDASGAEPLVSCQDAQGQSISEADYDGAVTKRFAGLEASALTLDWTMVETPPETPAPVMPEPSPPAITKHPSSEAIAIGGQTWFIAHANHAESLDWTLVDPEGKVYSLDEAMAANAGLTLEALEGDTLSVSDVPLSVNGWGVQAVFTGPGGSAVTEPAVLFVGDFLSSYSGVMEAYKAAYESGNNSGEYARGHELSELIADSNGLGYALKDLDKNGVPELLLVGFNTREFPETLVYDLYTLRDGAPLRLAVSQARKRYFVRTDSSLYWEGSDGASITYHALQRLSGDALEDVDMVFTGFDEADQSTVFYRQQGHSEALPGETSLRITEEEFLERQTQLQSTVYLPAATRLY